MSGSISMIPFSNVYSKWTERKTEIGQAESRNPSLSQGGQVIKERWGEPITDADVVVLADRNS
jgi:hypothetical protein